MFNTKVLLQNHQLFWQYPVITEETFYNQNKDELLYCGIPWATFIDKRISQNEIIKILIPFFTHKNYYTCCQHISFRLYFRLFKVLGITKVYTPHKIKNEDDIMGIQILPCPLYAVNIEDSGKNKIFSNVDFLNLKRDLLYSFMGGFQDNYISNIRKVIFEMTRDEKKSSIIKTGDWHFNKLVYSAKQSIKKELNIDQRHIDNTNKYNKLMLCSDFSLCPSGSGPNSIRFWESLGAGSIPVLLSDTLELPKHGLWDKAIIKINESEINTLNDVLESFSTEEVKERRKNCLEIYNHLKNNFKNNFESKKEITNRVLFTSYKVEKSDITIQSILLDWKKLNPTYEILYFSDKTVDIFFSSTPYYNTFKQMRNGVAIADFFRICYINKYGGYWFDIDIEPITLNLSTYNNIDLFDMGYKNISYMFIGGKPNQKLFDEVIQKVNENILNNIKCKKTHVLEITGPRIIQNIICRKLNIKNNDGCLPSSYKPTTYLQNTGYEFVYTKLNCKEIKTARYIQLQENNNQKPYQAYNYI